MLAAFENPLTTAKVVEKGLNKVEVIGARGKMLTHACEPPYCGVYTLVHALAILIDQIIGCILLGGLCSPWHAPWSEAKGTDRLANLDVLTFIIRRTGRSGNDQGNSCYDSNV